MKKEYIDELVINTTKLERVVEEIKKLYHEISIGQTDSGGSISAHSASSHIPSTLMKIYKIGTGDKT